MSRIIKVIIYNLEIMDKFDIQKLRDLPIEGVAERLGLQVKKHKSLCPFHDDSHPSLTFNVAKNTYKCYVCGAHGGVIDLVMRHLNKTFVEACQWLANENNIILSEWQPAQKQQSQKPRAFDPGKYLRFFEHPFLSEAARAFLFGERKLNEKVIGWCRLNSFTDKRGMPWLQIPYYDIDGKLIGVQSRNLTAQGPRFKFPYGHTCHIYNLPVLKHLKEGEPLYITEGASDCWSMLSSGHKAIAIPSATLLNRKDIETIRSTLVARQSTLHMYPDQDIPGEKLYLQLTRIATDSGLCLVRHSLPPGCKDYSDYYMRHLVAPSVNC